MLLNDELKKHPSINAEILTQGGSCWLCQPFAVLCSVKEGEVVREWGIRNRGFNSPIRTARLPATAQSADPEAVRVGADSKSSLTDT